jgi:hypothetical protein
VAVGLSIFESHFCTTGPKENLQSLTRTALEAADDIAIPLLGLLHGEDLTYVSLTAFENGFKASRNIEFTQALIQSTTIDVIDDTKALEIAGKEGHLDTMRLLLQRGAHINHIRVPMHPDLWLQDDPREPLYQRQPEGTPLHGLSQSDDNILTVEFLLGRGARTWIRNETGALPITTAK